LLVLTARLVLDSIPLRSLLRQGCMENQARSSDRVPQSATS
jgi:hypothetical protein